MKASITSLLIIFCFTILTSAQTPQDRATELKEQAQSSLKQKDYIKARYLFKKHTKHLPPAKTTHRQ